MEKMTDEEIARELSSMSADQVRNIQKHSETVWKNVPGGQALFNYVYHCNSRKGRGEEP